MTARDAGRENTAELFPEDDRNRKVALLLQQASGEPFRDCLGAVRRLGSDRVWAALRAAREGGR